MRIFSIAIGTICYLPIIATAHTGVGDATGFAHGFSHPISGLDHILAMVAVGLWASQLGGRATWMIPGAFVTVMLFGGILGLSGIPLPYVEEGILVSVVVLGILIASAFTFPVAISGIIVAFFSLFHGYAHGIEMPSAVGAISYSFGFALATALLHAAGISIQTLSVQKISRFAGAAIAIGGIYLAVS